MSSPCVAAEVLIGTRRPLQFAYLCLILFMLVYYARPEDWIPGVNVIPLAKITGALLILAFLLSLGQVRRRLPQEIIYLVLLLMQFDFAVFFSPVWRGGAFWTTLNFAKVVPVVVVMVLVLNTIPRLRRLIFLQTACMTIISVVTIWKGHISHGRLEGVLKSNYSNPNDLACQIAICLPFCMAFLLRTRSPIAKLAWSLAILLMTYAVFLTGSRAGFLSWAMAMAICIWEFAIKGRHRFLIAFALVGLVLLGLFGEETVRRLGAISSEREDPTAYASAQARERVLRRSLEVTASHPLFGVGLGNFQVLSGSWHGTHDTFTQLSAEGGIPALILYLLILWRSFVNVKTVMKYKAGGRDRALWAKTLSASFLAFLVGSCFAGDSYQYFTYFLVGYTSALFLVARRQEFLSGRASTTSNDSKPHEETHEPLPGSEPVWSSS